MGSKRGFSGVLLLVFSFMLASCNSDSADHSGAREPALTPPEAQASTSAPPPASSPETSAPPLSSDPAVLAARSFQAQGGTAVAMDFEDMSLELEFNIPNEDAQGKAVIRFRTLETGFPYLLLNAEVRSATLDGAAVETREVADPSGLNTVTMADKAIEPGVTHALELVYDMDPEEVSFRSGGVGFVSSMADIDDGNFFENYGPTNFEDDQYRMQLNIAIQGATLPHQLFTNGEITPLGATSWRIEFPAYFTTSSFYFHVTDKKLAVRRSTYQGLEKAIPITVYSSSDSTSDAAMEALPSLFSELESAYGPYLHPSFTAYISGAGGMEHDGATITSLSALGHELTHSWFGRGVKPSSGASGWIDEAIATWRDQGYDRSSGLASRSPVNLAALSPFERFTPFAAYNSGEQLMTELDFLFAATFGGMKPLLAEFFSQFKSRLVTTPAFENWLEQRTQTDVTPLFDRYVYGRTEQGGSVPPNQDQAGQQNNSLHPPALTPEEVEELR